MLDKTNICSSNVELEINKILVCVETQPKLWCRVPSAIRVQNISNLGAS